MAMRLHDNLVSGNGYKVRLLLRLTGRAFDWQHYDTYAGETRTPAFLALNPNGKIPVLELGDGRVLAESDAILWYLATGTRFLPDDPWLQAQVLQWMFFEQYSHEPYVAVARSWLTHLPADDPRRAELPARQEKGREALALMERHLAAQPFFVADAYTVADIALFAYTHVAEEGGIELAPFPAIRDWVRRIEAEPGHVPITWRPDRG